MQVIFERVDGRLYRIGAVRDGRRDVVADPEPPSEPAAADVPRELVRFVVEQQAGLVYGIFGRLAAGLDASLRPAPADRAATGRERTGGAGRDDVGVSDGLASLVGPDGRLLPDTGADAVSPALRAAIERQLADLLAQWQRTPPGGRLVLEWPAALTGPAR